MQKQIKVFIMAMAFVLGTVPTGNCQTSDLIDNIEIIAIKSMEVQSNILYIETEIKNSNSEMVKFGKGKFTFYLRINKAGHESLAEDEKLGVYNISEEIYLKTAQILLLNEDRKETNDVMFKVNLGKKQKQVLNKVKRIVNAIGNPSANNPILYIHGKFYMGVKSDKGWSSAQTGINWGFRPDLQERILLGALQQPPPDIEIRSGKELCGMRENQRGYAYIHFDLDSSVIRSESYPLLNEFGECLKNGMLSNAKFIIEGHTCNLGTRKYNQKLSEERAKSVKEYLMENYGIEFERLIDKGYGKDRPLSRFPNNTEADRVKNRRVGFEKQ